MPEAMPVQIKIDLSAMRSHLYLIKISMSNAVKNPAEIPSRAIAAGADMLLMPPDAIAAFNGLRQRGY